MSGPVRGTDDDGPLHYAPKRARVQDNQESGEITEGKARDRKAASPPEPPWKRKSHRGAFAGDIAIAELRNRLPECDDIPEPVLRTGGITLHTWMSRSIRVGLIASAGVIAYLWQSAPPEGLFVLAAGEKPAPTAPAAVLKSSRIDIAAAPAPQAANPVAPAAANTTTEAAARIADVEQNAAASAGSTTTTKPAAEELPPAWLPQPSPAVRAPPSSTAAAPAQKVLPNRPSDSASRPPNSQSRRLDADEIAVMMKSGADLMANGNVGAARMMFQAAAEADDPIAALALAETYDPLVLRRLGAKGGIASSLPLAHYWYAKAMELGSTVAPDRLARLARVPE